MSTLAYPYSVRDSANSSTDNRKTGLTPTVSNGKTLVASPATVLSSTVTIVEIGFGDYIALYDAEANGDASFPIDWGSALSNPNDRYGTLILTRDGGRVLTALPNAAPGASGGLPTLNSSLNVSADAKAINAVSTASVTTVNANIGLTQPLNFTGTGGSALAQADTRDFLGQPVQLDGSNFPKVDVADIAGSAVSASTAQLGVNLVNIAGSAVSASTAQLGVNLVNISGSPVSTASAQLGVNAVNIAGQAATLDANNLLKVDVADWGGAAVAGAIPPDVVFLHSGTAQAGGANTITLDAGASATNNAYQNQIVFIRSGTGIGQSATISSYVGSTKVATIVGSWATNPDNTSVFTLLPAGSITATVSGGVNVTQWAGTNVASPTVAGVPVVDLEYTRGVASAAQAGTVGIDWAHVVNANSAVSLSATTINSTGSTFALVGSVIVGSYAPGADPATQVLEALASAHDNAGTIGAKINSGGSGGGSDPWATAEPGSYAQGTFGYLIGHQLAGTFTTSTSSAFSQAALANAPGGAGSGTTAITDLAGGSARNPSVMTVLGLGGQPLFGAIVQAYLASAYATNPAVATVQAVTTTDANGHWTLNVVTNSGAITIVISMPGDTTAVLPSAVTV